MNFWKGNLGLLGYHPHILQPFPDQIANQHLTQHRPSPKTKAVIQKSPLCVSYIGYPPVYFPVPRDWHGVDMGPLSDGLWLH